MAEKNDSLDYKYLAFRKTVGMFYAGNNDYWASFDERQMDAFTRFYEGIVNTNDKVVGDLKEREVAVLRSVMEGKKSRAIAKELGVSITTVRTDFAHATRKILDYTRRGYISLSELGAGTVTYYLERALKNNLDHRYEFEASEELQVKQQEQLRLIVSELKNKDIDRVNCISELQTKLLRKYVGAFETKKKVKEISDELKLNEGTVRTFINNALDSLNRRILRGCIDFEAAAANGELSKEDILNMPLAVSDKIETRIISPLNWLSSDRICTYGTLYKISLQRLRNLGGMGERGYNIVKNHLDAIGLNLPEKIEVPVEETIKEKSPREKRDIIIRMEIKNITECVERENELDEEIKKCNKEIEKITARINDYMNDKKIVQENKEHSIKTIEYLSNGEVDVNRLILGK